MTKQSMERGWMVARVLIAASIIILALHIQITERKSSEEADRAWAARLEAELAESRAGAELQENPSPEAATQESGKQPLPDTVLRRGESGGSALQKALDSRDARLAHLEESLAALERQTGQSDRALRRALEELRTAVRREQDVAIKVQGLLFAALAPLLLHLLTSCWPRGDRRDDEE
jgi:phosphatidylserine/phosphatidylglycerophosphate/cardiolipin synthase-like enzyme